ncbi:SDR family NAD(P)-dependent oxidoreductase [Microbacterium pseudoresistens]|uniref:NAD(P)-dependent dehydrogenase (Short-subunit alcohol dehydrogenase family) n=1 Tax=Microbacterium pseudoresistens TaxID=640634 RepID=A0A7Y9JML5_9MICO|nr:SDR family NAD(P)-dependent oxidoreductase [Microbacterium pseudoresistens]NYD54922.1 NAD(P)-dependent dehydrogenase (short-subunit alcohol dehydrogenase family) [Microbacterium pseudoresistens]
MTGTHENPSAPERLFDVRGRGALVTGAASGLGQAFARVLARNGARVTLADVAAESLAAAVDELADEGCEVRGAVVDIRDRASVERALDAASSWGDGLDIVFANAGISAGRGHHFGDGVLARIDDERWAQVLETNLTGTMHTVRGAAARMNDGGRIVVTSSVAGHRADPLVGYAYSATKAAVSHLVRNAAAELAPRGIRVNAIAPGSFLTGIGRGNAGNGEMLEALTRATALDRLAEPEEIEGLALLLASPASSHITGAVFVIDGGVMIHTT